LSFRITYLAYFREEYPLPPEHVYCMLEAATGKHFWNFREELAENGESDPDLVEESNLHAQ
jgi:hypothetical protein